MRQSNAIKTGDATAQRTGIIGYLIHKKENNGESTQKSSPRTRFLFHHQEDQEDKNREEEERSRRRSCAKQCSHSFVLLTRHSYSRLRISRAVPNDLVLWSPKKKKNNVKGKGKDNKKKHRGGSRRRYEETTIMAKGIAGVLLIHGLDGFPWPVRGQRLSLMQKIKQWIRGFCGWFVVCGGRALWVWGMSMTNQRPGSVVVFGGVLCGRLRWQVVDSLPSNR